METTIEEIYNTLDADMPEHINTEVRTGPERGNSTYTLVRLFPNGNGCNELRMMKDGVVEIVTYGTWERDGLIRAFESMAAQLREASGYPPK